MTDSTDPWTAAMRDGRYAEAWAIERATIAARDPATRDDPRLPYHRRWVWDGRALDGCRVLVRCYHGLGDTLQFARYLPALAARAAHVTLEVQPRLVPLLGRLGVDRIVPFDVAAPLPPAECDIGITELPGALGIAPDDLAAPYLSWSPAPLPPGTVGLCPSAGDWDVARSIPEALLAPLCARGPTVMLAVGTTALPCLNPEGCPADMAATAALVAGVERIVTVDTMIAHLAGAMGRPVHLLLKAAPDWRWPLAARRSAWYPTMTLHPQPTPGDWPGAVADLLDHLSAASPDRSPVPWPA